MNPKNSPLVALVMLILSALACGSPDVTPSVISTSPVTAPAIVISSFTPEPLPTDTAKPSTYIIGDVIQLSDRTVVLNSAAIENNVLKANFTIENTGSEPISVSSIASFSVKDADGVKMEQEFFNCGTSFDGNVIAGDKLKGDICWSLAQAKALPIKIYYQPQMFSADIIVVWVVNP